MDKFKSYYPDKFEFVPKSYKLPEERSILQNVMKLEKRTGKQKFYISKPSKGNQGLGIQLVKKFKNLSSYHDLIVQEYISIPLLIENTKFDLRLYVLVTSLRPFTAFICKEGMARFCTAKY